ncbi:unnamed protein product [marine sediment metagenome]|uniref:SCP2 domain-containing protein n=1 Tax=marine sediment metagenome TaxID=412755 RepID=X1D200_9ZZZZ
MLNETMLLNFARLAKILIDVYGFDEAFQKVGKREGQEIEFYFPTLDGCLTFVLVKNKFDFEPNMGRANNPVATAIVDVKRDEILPLMSDVVCTKNNIFGLLKIFFKYIITRRVKINGSLLSFIRLFRCLAIGKHEMYKFKEKS